MPVGRLGCSGDARASTALARGSLTSVKVQQREPAGLRHGANPRAGPGGVPANGGNPHSEPSDRSTEPGLPGPLPPPGGPWAYAHFKVLLLDPVSHPGLFTSASVPLRALPLAHDIMSPCAPHAPTAAHLRCSKPEMAGADEGDCVIIEQSYNRGCTITRCSGYACKSLLLNLERKLEAPTGCFQTVCLQRLIRPMATRRSWNSFPRIDHDQVRRIATPQQ